MAGSESEPEPKHGIFFLNTDFWLSTCLMLSLSTHSAVDEGAAAILGLSEAERVVARV